MKRIAILFSSLLFLAFALCGCGGDGTGSQDGASSGKEYTIVFDQPPVSNIFLTCLNEKGKREKLIDTLKVDGTTASFNLDKFKDINPSAYVLVQPQVSPFHFMPQEGGLKFKVLSEEGKVQFETTELSDDNKVFAQYNEMTHDFMDKAMEFQQKFSTADEGSREQLENEWDEMNDEYMNRMVALLESNGNTNSSAVILASNMSPLSDNLQKFEALTSNIPESPIKEMLSGNIAKQKAIAVGQKFTDVELPGQDGKLLKLSEFAGKGKPVLLDFWASWCGPCRRENPVFREIYLKYKDKGFDIYAVSLDEDEAAWKKTIEDDKLTWHHVSNLNPAECPAADAYMINAIPSNVLIGADGVIVGRNLMGEKLEKALDELFKKKK